MNGDYLRAAAAALRDGDAPAATSWTPIGWHRRLDKRARTLDLCGSGRGYVVACDGVPSAIARDYCRDRMCPRCWARGASRREPIAAAIVAAARERLGLGAAFATLTRRPDDLRATDPRASIAGTRSIWRAVRQRMRRHPGLQAGGMVRWEATWRRPDGGGPARCHAHAHVLLLGSPSDADDLARAWCRAASDGGYTASAAGQDVQAIGDGADAPVTTYLLKYLAKAGDLPDAGTVALAAWAWRGQRVVDYWGACHGAALRSASPHPMAGIADECRRAVALERARYTIQRIGIDAINAASWNAGFLSDVVAAVGADCPCWAPVALAGAAVEAARTGKPGDLLHAAELVAALPLTPTVGELLGLATPAEPARPHCDGQHDDDDQRHPNDDE